MVVNAVIMERIYITSKVSNNNMAPVVRWRTNRSYYVRKILSVVKTIFKYVVFAYPTK